MTGVIVDTKVIEKEVAYPVNSSLSKRRWQHLVNTAQEWRLCLRQTYTRQPLIWHAKSDDVLVAAVRMHAAYAA
jgi:hypothetical protein